MKRKYWMVLVVSLLFPGCGGSVDWFPSGTNTNNGTTTSSPVLTKSYTPSAVLTGTDSTLTFSIINSSGDPAQTGMAFTDQLTSGLTVTATSPQCGGTVTAANSKITFTGGLLAAGTKNCTITAKVSSATSGSFLNKTADISGLAGGLLNYVTDQTLTVFPTSVTTGSVTVSNLVASIFQADATNISYQLLYDAVNTGATDATITVTATGIDASGTAIATVSTAVGGEFISAQTTVPVQFFMTVDVPVATAGKILFWRIVSLTL